MIIQRNGGGVCVLRGPVADSLKLYLVQVKAGADVREGERVSVCVGNGKEGRGEEGSNTSVQVAAWPSALS